MKSPQTYRILIGITVIAYDQKDAVEVARHKLANRYFPEKEDIGKPFVPKKARK